MKLDILNGLPTENQYTTFVLCFMISPQPSLLTVVWRLGLYLESNVICDCANVIRI